MFLGKDREYLTESRKVQCKKGQRQAACSSAQTVSMAPSTRGCNFASCSTCVNTLDRTLQLDNNSVHS